MQTVRVFVVQDRETGWFFDQNMLPVRSLRYAVRAESERVCHEAMATAIEDGVIECPFGYEVHMFFEAVV